MFYVNRVCAQAWKAFASSFFPVNIYQEGIFCGLSDQSVGNGSSSHYFCVFDYNICQMPHG